MRTCIVTVNRKMLSSDESYPDSHALVDPSGALRIVKGESGPGCEVCGNDFKEMAIYAPGTWTGVRYEEKE